MGELYDSLLDILMTIACILLAFAMFLISLDVILRYGFNSPLGITMVATEFILVAIVSLGSAWLLREEGHVTIDILLEKFPEKLQYFINGITSIISAFVLLTIFVFGIPELSDLIVTKATVMNTDAPRYIYVLPLNISYMLFGIQFVRRSNANFKKYAQMIKKG